MDDRKGKTAHAKYNNFAVGSEKDKYRLHSIGNFTGDAGQWNDVDYHICTYKLTK